MYSYVDLTATVLNCRLPTTEHIKYIGLSWFALPIFHEKTETGKNRNLGFLCKTEPKLNQKWNRRTVTALLFGYFMQAYTCYVPDCDNTTCKRTNVSSVTYPYTILLVNQEIIL